MANKDYSICLPPRLASLLLLEKFTETCTVLPIEDRLRLKIVLTEILKISYDITDFDFSFPLP